MYIAKPEAPNGKAVILIHEFWGLNDQMKRVAARLSREGFLALATDLYDGKVTKNADEASRLRNNLNIKDAVSTIKKNLIYLEEDHRITGNKTAIWGFCMGGMVAFEAALHDIGAGAYVIYYGRITDDKEILQSIKKPILGIFGGLDKGIPKNLVVKFRKSMEELGKKIELQIYDDADHAFFNEERVVYNQKAAEEAWEKTILFLDGHLAEEDADWQNFSSPGSPKI